MKENKNIHNNIFDLSEIYQLEEAILSIKNYDRLSKFLQDLCTPSELKTLKERWKIFQLLASEKHNIKEIHYITGASINLITRVAKFLKDDSSGKYRNILKDD